MADLVTNHDLAPDAGILGTQIADKTIQLRNISDDVFGIVASGTYTLALSNPIIKDEIDSGSVAHNLGFAPVLMAFVTIPSTITGHPYIAGKLQKLPVIFAGGAFIEAIVDANVDSTNVNFYAVNVWSGALSWGLTSLTFKYYLLQESASIT